MNSDDVEFLAGSANECIDCGELISHKYEYCTECYFEIQQALFDNNGLNV